MTFRQSLHPKMELIVVMINCVWETTRVANFSGNPALSTHLKGIFFSYSETWITP